MARSLKVRGRVAVAAAAFLLLAGVAPATATSTGPPVVAADEPLPAVEAPTEAGTYIVELAEPPVVAYEGGVAGLRATKPAKGEKINPLGRDVVRYVAHLQGQQDAVLRAAGGGEKLASYTYAFNGFAAELTGVAAAKMADVDGVVAVTQDELRQLDTTSTPDFLGLTATDGLWQQLTTGASRGRTTTGPGENVIIGIIDSGIWPEHPSVSDRDGTGKRVYQQVPGWNGRCVPGEEFAASLCNQKLIGARFYNAGFGGNAGIDAAFDYEFNSPRDADGHGTHTATTAGGNADVATSGPAEVFGTVSGIAPRARIAAYKVCWGNGGEGGCFNTDSVAAIDQAVADGVDVINFSISGTRTNFRDPVEIAFLFAADAGVFVAASAGNSGPATSTVAHPSPWVTTVAAGTHNRDGRGVVTLGNGNSYTGASVATAVGPVPLVDAVAVGAADTNADEVELCYPGTLDPAQVAGKIVVCKRGVIARTDKSLAVQQAGGVGMVLYNSPDSSLNADFHFVPTVHVNLADGLAIKAYAATPGATASIGTATIVTDAPAPFTASFSSRGPLLAGDGDLLKPDLIAPGQDILAGVSPVGYGGRLFDLLSGTSMSSPHVAGLAALLIQAHPTWSPMAVKSALMTTGYDVLDGGTPAPNGNPVLIFRQGAGHVAPNKAVNPGLVFDSGFNDWLSLICATQPDGLASTCGALATAGYPTDASDFNGPSIAIGALPGTQTVTRTVTNVSGAEATFAASTSGMAGIATVVSPSSLTLAPGATGQFTVTFTRTTAALNAYVGGQLTWSDGTHDVRIPMVVRPVAFAAPASVSSNGDPIDYDVTFGYTGDFSATGRGLVPATVTADTVAQDPDQVFDPGDSTGTVAIPVTILAGTTYQRFALFDSDVAPGADLDLYVYQGATQVGTSQSGTSAEEVNFSFANPTANPIVLTVYVHGWGVPSGSSPFVLHEFSVPATDAGNMTVTAPTAATTGETGTVDLTFSGLDPATRYLGAVAYSGAAGLPSPTIVAVTTP
jgi:subtilisin family serine protease